MIAIGIVTSWFGYAVFYYGLDTVSGGNDSFLSLIWPGKYKVTAKDGGGTNPTGITVAPGSIKAGGTGITGVTPGVSDIPPGNPYGLDTLPPAKPGQGQV